MARQQAQMAAAYMYAKALIEKIHSAASSYRGQLDSDRSALQAAIAAQTAEANQKIRDTSQASAPIIKLLGDGASQAVPNPDAPLLASIDTPRINTNDRAHAARLEGIKSRIADAYPRNSNQQIALQTASLLIEASDEASSEGDTESAQLLAEMAEILVDIATGFPPGIGWARDVYEACSGTNLVSGAKLSEWEHGLAILGAVSGGVGSKVVTSGRVLQRLAKVTQRLLQMKILTATTNTQEVQRAYKVAQQVITAWNKAPNKIYEVGSYKYKTDKFSRVVSVSGDLRLERVASDSYQQRKVRDAIGQLGDDAGHLISGRFGGTASPINLVPMESGLNRGLYKSLEDKWVDALGRQSSVKVTITPNYLTNSPRPSTIGLSYDIDGSVVDMTLFNRAPGTK